MQNNRWKLHFSVVYESKQPLFIYNYCGSFGIIFVVSPLGDFLAFALMLLLSVVGQRTKNQQRQGGIMVASFHFHFTCVSVFFFFWWCLLLSLMFSCAPHPPIFPSHLSCSCLIGPALFLFFLPQLPPCCWGFSAPHPLLGLICFLNPVFSSIFVESSVLFSHSWCLVAFACSLCWC